jgi:hypothetical protein
MATTEIKKEEVKLPSEFKGCLAFVLYNVFTKTIPSSHYNISIIFSWN